jgi:general secretion pathway protein H
LLVVALIAGLTGMVMSGSGALGGMRQRAAASLISNSVRTALTRANSMGHPVRLVFDLEGGRIRLEETRDPMLRVRSADEGAKGGAQAATDAEKAAAEYAKDIMQGPRAPSAGFAPVPDYAAAGDDPALGRELGAGVRYLQVQTEHDVEPRTEGHAYLYFWPGGGTERASIQIARQGDTTGLTVLVSALTGRTRMVRGRIEMEEGRREVDFQEREEP